MPESGNTAQVQIVAEQVADTAITRFAAKYPDITQPKPEIPAPLKWAAGIISAIITLALGGMAMWLVATVNEMQVTLARIDERMESRTQTVDTRFVDYERRINALEEDEHNGS